MKRDTHTDEYQQRIRDQSKRQVKALSAHGVRFDGGDAMSDSARNGARQAMALDAPGPAAALTPRVGGPDEGCGNGKHHAGPDESSGADNFPEGWCLGANTYRFHRQFFARVGRPTRFAEYSGLLAQIRHHVAEPLGGEYYRLKLHDGSPLVVRSKWFRMFGVEHADWTPPAPKPAKPVQPVIAATPAESAPAAAVTKPSVPAEPEPPRKPVRASTLTLGSPAAAKALAERLRRMGVPESLVRHAPSPP